MTRVASIGVSSPSLTALRTLPAATEASIALLIIGMENVTVASLGGGAIRSIQSRKATLSPSSALVMAACVNASAWPCSRLSMASVALFLEPRGLPEFPAENWPAVFLPFLICYIVTKIKIFNTLKSYLGKLKILNVLYRYLNVGQKTFFMSTGDCTC